MYTHATRSCEIKRGIYGAMEVPTCNATANAEMAATVCYGKEDLPIFPQLCASVFPFLAFHSCYVIPCIYFLSV
jgi:hypothetical protein